jgi:hypothetical protein
MFVVPSISDKGYLPVFPLGLAPISVGQKLLKIGIRVFSALGGSFCPLTCYKSDTMTCMVLSTP